MQKNFFYKSTTFVLVLLMLTTLIIFSDREDDSKTKTVKSEVGSEEKVIDRENNQLKVGVHVSTREDILMFESRTKSKLDYVAIHLHWGNENFLPKDVIDAVTLRNSTLFIFWNAMDYSKDESQQSEFYFKEILSGQWDSYIEAFKNDVKNHNGKVVIVPFEEMNGEWTYWNGTDKRYGSKQEYLETYRYLRDKFRDADNVSFAWVVNNESVPDTADNAIENYYPGDKYVDLIGINAFNFDEPWRSFDELVSTSTKILSSYNKPMIITSTASAEGLEKSKWIDILFESKYFKNDTLDGFIWFNENKEKNWLVWSDSEAEVMFRNKINEIQ